MSSNISDTNLYVQAHTHNHSGNWVLTVVEAEILWEEEGFQFGFKRFQGRPSHIKPRPTPLTRSLELLLPKWLGTRTELKQEILPKQHTALALRKTTPKQQLQNKKVCFTMGDFQVWELSA